ncbi:MAG: VWA domain-containing protein, partial [Flavobacteriales bacterium]
ESNVIEFNSDQNTLEEMTTISTRVIAVDELKTITGGIPACFMDRSGGVGGYADPGYKGSGPKAIPGASPAFRVNHTSAGTLTGGEINDFQKWQLWSDLSEGELNEYRERWNIHPTERYCVMARNRYHAPLANVEVQLIDNNGGIIWETKTDITGKAECWNQFDRNASTMQVSHILLHYGNEQKKIEQPLPFAEGLNQVDFSSECQSLNHVDIHFAVDATGSMGDEIEYLQTELSDVMQQVKKKHEHWNLHLGATFYRDYGDTYVTQSSRAKATAEEVYQFMSEQYADGGGDGPEAVQEALEAALKKQPWHDDALARILFLILDAPPHDDTVTVHRMQRAIHQAAQSGVKIIPVVASGGGFDQDKSLEYIMRCCALGTNGTYTFLTDDSGVGEQHTAPSTDHFEVEKLNAMLIRLIESNATVPDCHTELPLIEPLLITPIPADTTQLNLSTGELPTDTSMAVAWELQCYPNPTTNYIWAQCDITPDVIYIADSQGKLLLRAQPVESKHRFPLDGFPTGTYLMIAEWGTERKSTRFVVTNQ